MNTVLPVVIILVIAVLCVFLIYQWIRLKFE